MTLAAESAIAAVDRELLDGMYWSHFGAFTYQAYEALNPGQPLIPNWHIDAICHHVQQMVTGDARKRLILNLPPRTLKSFIASVALPAWCWAVIRVPGLFAPATLTNSRQNSRVTAAHCWKRSSINACFRAQN
jgi:hypothetical protein